MTGQDGPTQLTIKLPIEGNIPLPVKRDHIQQLAFSLFGHDSRAPSQKVAVKKEA